MPDEDILLDVPFCWNCGHDETITQKSWKMIYPDDEEIPFTSAVKDMIPMTAYSPEIMMSLPSVPGIILHTDYCAKCGAPRATRCVRTFIPGYVFQQMMPQQGNQPPRR